MGDTDEKEALNPLLSFQKTCPPTDRYRRTEGMGRHVHNYPCVWFYFYRHYFPASKYWRTILVSRRFNSENKKYSTTLKILISPRFKFS